MPDATQSVDWNVNAPIMSPDGNLHAIPKGLIPQALAQPGAKRAIPMLGTDGTHRWVPEDQLQPAVQSGARISWPSQEVPKWFGFTPSNVASNAWSGAKGLVGGIYDLGSDLANNPNWFEGKNSTYQKFIGAPAEQQVVKAGQALNAGHTSEALGHGLASAVPLVGPWAAGLGEQAGSGDVGGAAGQVAGVMAVAPAAKLAGRVANRVIPSTARAAIGLNDLAQRYPSHPVDTAQRIASYDKIKSDFDKIGKPVPPEIQTQMEDLQAHNAASNSPAIQQQLQAGNIGDPATFGDAYRRLTLINQIIRSAQGFGPPDPDTSLRINALKQFSGALDADIKAGAGTPSSVAPQGFLTDYARYRREYAGASAGKRAVGELGPLIGGGVGYEVGKRMGGGVGPVGDMLLGGMAGRFLGKKVMEPVGQAAFGRNAGPPTNPLAYDAGQGVRNAIRGVANQPISLPPIPRTSEEYLRTMLAAKEGDISPGEMERRLKRGGARMKVQPLPSPPQ